MKNLSLLLFTIITLFSCNTSKNIVTNTDINGVVYSYNDENPLTVNILNTQKNNLVINKKLHQYENYDIEVGNIYKLKDKKTGKYSTMNFKLKDAFGKVIKTNNNVLKGFLDPENNKVLKINLLTNDKYIVNEEYTITLEVFKPDTKKPMVNISYTFKIIPKKHILKFNKFADKKFDFKDILFFDENGNSVGNKIKRNKNYLIVLKNLGPFSPKNDSISIQQSLHFMDKNNVMLHKKLLKESKYLDDKNKVHTDFYFPINIKSPFNEDFIKFKVFLFDANLVLKMLDFEIDFTIED